jgi:hypothetical protein
VIVEKELASEREASSCPIPPFCGAEISSDADFEGATLSTDRK